MFLREADIILARESLNLLSDAFALSFTAWEKEIQNVEITSVLNTFGLALAVSRFLSPIGASVFNNLISVAVSLNSLRMLYRQPDLLAGHLLGIIKFISNHKK